MNKHMEFGMFLRAVFSVIRTVCPIFSKEGIFVVTLIFGMVSSVAIPALFWEYMGGWSLFSIPLVLSIVLLVSYWSVGYE